MGYQLDDLGICRRPSRQMVQMRMKVRMHLVHRAAHIHRFDADLVVELVQQYLKFDLATVANVG